MQAFISLPSAEQMTNCGGPRAGLRRRVCGIPLLVRVLETAVRSGVRKALLVRPESLPESEVLRALRGRLLKNLEIEILTRPRAFDPQETADWKSLENRLESKFLWLPWNTVLDKRRLAPLIHAGKESENGARFHWNEPESEGGAGPESPQVISKAVLYGGQEVSLRRFAHSPSLQVVDMQSPLVAPVTNRRAARDAEEDLLQWSGKDWDGIFSKFNRRLCWPFMRILWNTHITPNTVTFGGLLVAILAGYYYAQGHYWAYVAGGLFYFAAVLFDEMDGMLARLTFRDSAFGCWLETFVDYASYVLLYGGITIGLYRQSGSLWLVIGALLMIGVALSIITLSDQRKRATEPDKPHEYQLVFYETMEENPEDFVSRNTRQLQFLIKKAVMCHHLLIFSVLGILKIHILLSAIGANLVWTSAIYLNRYFQTTRRPSPVRAARPALSADQPGGSA